jgi:hypothetical protein
MTSPLPRTGSRKEAAKILAAVLSLLLIPADTLLLAQQTAPAPAPSPAAAPAPAAEPEAVKLSADQLAALVAPIALYPDPLLAQVLVASTYPLDVVQAQQWLAKNEKLKGDALSKAAEQQPWDPSVQALVLLPDALKLLGDNISWTKDLGDAFLAQQEDVMAAVQNLRRKAKDDGKLESTEQQKVETTTEEGQTVVVIQPANPEVVYVPTYNPTVVWGAPAYYPYPPIYYPPPYYGGAWLGFGVGVAIGIGISGGWGWGCGWGHNDININYNNNFVNNSNRNNNINRSGNGSWQHNAKQRGGVPYKDKATASKYGGGTRGSQASNRQAGAGGMNRGGPSAGTMDRGAGSANRGGASAGSMDRGAGSANRGGASAGTMDRGGAGGSRGGSSVGTRNVPSSPRATNGTSYGGSQSASRARSSSSRGSSSMSSSRGGGMSRGGGGMSRGGGGRGGGRR